jgi:hypothetical protein
MLSSRHVTWLDACWGSWMSEDSNISVPMLIRGLHWLHSKVWKDVACEAACPGDSLAQLARSVQQGAKDIVRNDLLQSGSEMVYIHWWEVFPLLDR